MTASHSQSLERGLSILTAFKPGRPLLGVSDLARELELTGPTTHRYVATLANLGYLEQDELTRKYRLGPRTIDFGLAALEAVELRDIATPLLRALSNETGHTVNMAVLRGTEIVYVERIRSFTKEHAALDLDLRVGSRQPAYCTGMGKALLAFLPPEQLRQVLEQIVFVRLTPKTIVTKGRLLSDLDGIRTLGMATCDEEYSLGMRSISAPIRIHTERWRRHSASRSKRRR